MPISALSLQLVNDALTDARKHYDHLDSCAGQDISFGGVSGDYAYVDRSFGGAAIDMMQ